VKASLLLDDVQRGLISIKHFIQHRSSVSFFSGVINVELVSPARFNSAEASSNNMKQGGQTEPTCCIQQRWTFLNYDAA